MSKSPFKLFVDRSKTGIAIRLLLFALPAFAERRDSDTGVNGWKPISDDRLFYLLSDTPAPAPNLRDYSQANDRLAQFSVEKIRDAVAKRICAVRK